MIVLRDALPVSIARPTLLGGDHFNSGSGVQQVRSNLSGIVIC